MSKKSYRIIANQSQTKFKVQYLKETFVSKLANVFSPGVVPEFEWKDVTYSFSECGFDSYFGNLINAEKFLQNLIQDEIDKDAETWTVVKSPD